MSARSTVPSPSDQAIPVAPPSPLATIALAAGVSAADVRAYLTSRYSFTAGLVSP